MMSTSFQTHNHQTIREWAEKRGGVPSRVIATEINGDEGGLRIHFPGFSKTEDLEEISWEDFLNDFEKERLDLLYQDHKVNGEPSTFYKLVARLG